MKIKETILEKYKKEFETIGTIIYQEEAKGILSKALDEQREEIIKVIKKTAKCEAVSWGKEANEIIIDLQNPKEVADAVLKVIFGEDMAEMMAGQIDMDEVAKKFNKKHRDKKMVKAKK